MSNTTEKCAGAIANREASCELAGMRVQLMNALNFVHRGSLLIYRMETSCIENRVQLMLGEYLAQDRNWLPERVVPLLVPGTICPQMIGESLIRFGWVKPDGNDGIGYMRNYVLSESGRKAMEMANSWWSSLHWFEKAWLSLTE